MITTSSILAISVFTGVILILVLILNFAESKLLPQGDVDIKIITDSTKTGATTDSRPTARPDIITVAVPVSPDLAIFWTGEPPV